MGYWRQGADGSSLHEEDTGLIWGDQPADIFGDAVDEVVKVFQRDRGRRPTRLELIAGLRFTLGIYEEGEAEINPAPLRPGLLNV